MSACFYALSTKDGLPAPAERASLTEQLGSISPCIAPYRLRWALLKKVGITVLSSKTNIAQNKLLGYRVLSSQLTTLARHRNKVNLI